jgi:superfamily II DNA/RNA helicase
MVEKAKNNDRKIEKFKDFPIDNQIKRALSELGFQKPMEVQIETIPLILEGKDLIVKSQTGSGKTAAFAIPICEKIDVELESPQVVVLAPTRELAVQVKEDIQDIGRYKGVKCCVVYGKQPIEHQKRELKKGPHVVVATPGRMMDHLIRRNVKLHDVKYLIIDEADEMLMMGFQEQIEEVIKKIPTDRITLMFSATMPQKVIELSQLYMKRPISIETVAEVSTIDKIQQIYYAVDGLKKVDFMRKMIKHESPRKAIIFCNTQEQVNRLFDIMRKNDRQVCAVHGGMDQGLRMGRLKGFKRGEYNILIATDVAARGLHVEGVTHVINYGVPFDHENYVHRIGRTGRVDQNGIAITMVIPREMERFEDLQKFLGYTIPCKGGHVDRKPKAEKSHKNARQRYKEEKRKGQKAIIQINAGRVNSKYKAGDILSAMRSVGDVDYEDIGKIDIRDVVTNVTIHNGKEDIILRAFKTKKIRGKLYRMKRG